MTDNFYRRGFDADEIGRDLNQLEVLIGGVVLALAGGYFEIYLTILEFGDGPAAGLVWLFIFGPMCTAAVFSVCILLIAGVAQLLQWWAGRKQEAADDR